MSSILQHVNSENTGPIKERLSKLFRDIELNRKPKRETTLLSIGGRGYYENPASELLQFFFGPQNEHGLETLFIKALKEALSEATELELPDHSLNCITVDREVRTGAGNRIDLVLKAPDWILLIENKIWHEQANPFEDYEKHSKLSKNPGDKEFYLILSPSGESSQTGWHGLSYIHLIAAIEERLNNCEAKTKATKWWHFAKDFALHLKQELYGTPMTDDEIKFAEQNYGLLEEAVQLQNRYQTHLLTYLPNLIDGKYKTNGASAKLDSWCVRLYHIGWPQSNIAWWWDDKDRNQIKFSIYIESPTDNQLTQAKATFEDLDYWTESGGKWQCWKTSNSFESREVAEKPLLKLTDKLFEIFPIVPTS